MAAWASGRTVGVQHARWGGMRREVCRDKINGQWLLSVRSSPLPDPVRRMKQAANATGPGRAPPEESLLASVTVFGRLHSDPTLMSSSKLLTRGMSGRQSLSAGPRRAVLHSVLPATTPPRPPDRWLLPSGVYNCISCDGCSNLLFGAIMSKATFLLQAAYHTAS